MEDGSEGSTLTLESLLAFVTGADHPPPLGFRRRPQIMFKEDDGFKLPTASTCTPALYVPISLTEYNDFKRAFDLAITSAINVFGSV